MLLFAFCAADVPDAPMNLEISEFPGDPRNVSLSWIPGSDHNSSVTGTRKQSISEFCTLCSFCEVLSSATEKYHQQLFVHCAVVSVDWLLPLGLQLI